MVGKPYQAPAEPEAAKPPPATGGNAQGKQPVAEQAQPGAEEPSAKKGKATPPRSPNVTTRSGSQEQKRKLASALAHPGAGSSTDGPSMMSAMRQAPSMAARQAPSMVAMGRSKGMKPLNNILEESDTEVEMQSAEEGSTDEME